MTAKHLFGPYFYSAAGMSFPTERFSGLNNSEDLILYALHRRCVFAKNAFSFQATRLNNNNSNVDARQSRGRRASSTPSHFCPLLSSLKEATDAKMHPKMKFR